MASGMANGSNMQNGRNGRLGNFGQTSSDQPRSSQATSMGKGFGNNGWKGSIWGNGSFGSGFSEGPTDTSRPTADIAPSAAVDSSFEGKTGSGSLLPSSESDGWNARQALPWGTALNTTYPPLANVHGKNLKDSPARHRHSDHSAPPQSLKDSLRNSSSYFPSNRPSAIGQGMGPSPSKPLLNHSPTTFQPRVPESSHYDNFQPKKLSDDVRRQFSNGALGGYSTPSGVQVMRGGFVEDLTSDDGITTSNGNLASSRDGMGIESMSHMAAGSNGSMPYAHYSRASASFASQRPSHSAHPSFHSERQVYEDTLSQTHDADLSAQLGRFTLEADEAVFNPHDPIQRSTYTSPPTYDPSLGRNNYQLNIEAYHTLGSYTPEGIPEGPFAPHVNGYRPNLGDRSSTSPGGSDYRRSLHTPLYSTGGTPPVSVDYRSTSGSGLSSRTSMGQAALLDKKLSRLQQEQQGYVMPTSNTLHPRLPYGSHPYEYQTYGSVRMNPLTPYYTIGAYPQLPTTLAAPRGPSREQEQSHVIRSPLLEEFRTTNNKTTKRYELKEIYNHIVEFSGDQHGSRFIQQKLETANSDEKEQVFAEIQTNSIQLMTDVFGNYVIQKLFEHGNQTQKKALANQMKGHMLALSTQPYGCRVVQKALEHILTDQQASLVKELENHVLKCVKDQNGNHVIQKAIERVPAEHIQFIIHAFTDQVHRLATHPYGCRVIQRMLEHCEETSRRSILVELHACSQHLITDQYGNYVTQHVIVHGDEKDRSKIITIIISQLLVYSKHKFASNVVEKSIEYGTEDQRAQIFKILTTPNDRGEGPLLGLMRDQFGNYVIQKMLSQLKGSDREMFVDQIKAGLVQLKKFSYGKQVAAIEKIIFDSNLSLKSSLPSHHSLTELDTSVAPTPPLLTGATQSPQSSSLPSTSNSTVEGPVEPGMKATPLISDVSITTTTS